jgi:hypothetical protein
VNDAGSDPEEIFISSFRDATVASDRTNLAESVTNSMTRGECFTRRASRTTDRIVKTSMTIYCLAERPYVVVLCRCCFLGQTGSGALPVARCFLDRTERRVAGGP